MNEAMTRPLDGRTFRVMDEDELDHMILIGLFPEEARGGFVLVDEQEKDKLAQHVVEGRGLDTIFHWFESREKFDELFLSAAAQERESALEVA